MPFIRVHIKEIVPDAESERCFRMILEDSEGGLEMPVVISEADARPLIALLDQDLTVRPQTHDLLQQFIRMQGFQMSRLEIDRFEKGVFHARLYLQGENDRVELDCRPSDGVALALRFQAPIYVDKKVMGRVGSLLNNDIGSMKLPQRIEVMEKKLSKLALEERYEEAAILRDRINILKSEIKG